jgi:hypothetical protein
MREKARGSCKAPGLQGGTDAAVHRPAIREAVMQPATVSGEGQGWHWPLTRQPDRLGRLLIDHPE